jgi:hypothetical protein
MEGEMDRLLPWQHTLAYQRDMDMEYPSRGSINASPLSAVAGTKALRVKIGDVLDQDSRELNITVSKDGAGLPPLDPRLLLFAEDMGEEPAIRKGSCNSSPVLIKWKSFSHQMRIISIQRAKNLAILLKETKYPSFRSLQCKGMIEDSDASRLPFVFHHPYAENNPQQPVSLRELFRQPAPSATARLRRFTIEIIVLCGRRLDLILNPFLAGFTFSRLDSPTELSEPPSEEPESDVYRRPDALGRSLHALQQNQGHLCPGNGALGDCGMAVVTGDCIQYRQPSGRTKSP